MPATVQDIIKVLEEIAPVRLSESWDNPGLQVGDVKWPVKKILVSLDPTLAVMNHAAEASADMLVTHHPLLFRPVKSVDLSTPGGKILAAAIEHRIAIYAAHTNLDVVAEGLNDMLAVRLGLKNVSILAPTVADERGNDAETSKNGLGRLGDLPEETDLLTFSRTLKAILKLENVRFVGDARRRVRRVALCTGSGGSLIDRFFSSGADVFITGDVRYHDARDAEDRQSALIDIGHFGSEHIMVKQLETRLGKILETSHPDVKVVACETEKDPFAVI